MDLALCTINFTTRTLQYSGAKNPLYLIREGQLEVIKADPMSIGGRPLRKAKEREFTNHIITLDGPVSIYMFTDGYMDQFGGTDGEKFSIRRFQNLLTEGSNGTMDDQKAALSDAMDAWKDNQRQIDDMLIVGIHC